MRFALSTRISAWSRCPTRGWRNWRKSSRRRKSSPPPSSSLTSPVWWPGLPRRGLGNRFLARIREVDAIAHVVRAFDDSAITHVAARVDPADDIDTVNTELLLADMQTAENAWQRASNQSKSGDKAQVALRDLLAGVKQRLEQGDSVRTMALDEHQSRCLKTFCFLTGKPTLYVANVGEDGLTDNPHLSAIERIAGAENAPVVAICAAIEQELSELDESEGLQFLAEMGCTKPGWSA